MNKINFLLILSLCILIAAPLCNAKTGHMPLLAVSQTKDGYVGSNADLYLEIKPGNGRVFIDTFPLTQLDTQISTRFAKSIACNYAEVDCDYYDFFYTIRADSSIIGGPSAGSAVAALTISMLENIKIDESTAITGTINSGGIVGPVSGLKEKIEAASKADLKKVLIPSGTRFQKQENESYDLVEYGKEISIEVIEVSDIDDILYEIAGIKKQKTNETPETSEEYSRIMMSLGEMLCSKSQQLKYEYESMKKDDLDEEINKIQQNAFNLSEKGKTAFDEEKYYSAASFCFGANTQYRYLVLLMQDLNKSEIAEIIESTRQEIGIFDSKIPFKYETITDLQTYAVVKERLIEAEDYLDISEENLGKGKKDESINSLAYAIERLYSAEAWSEFFNNKGESFDFSKDVLRESCQTKIMEAEERYQYVKMFFPKEIEGTRKLIDLAYEDMENSDYELCLFKASKAKAESDIILSTLGMDEEQIPDLIEKKLEIVGRKIVETSNKGLFPIVGYSYYEYAKTLKDDDKYSALLYSEYALELSNLEIYFEKSKKPGAVYFDSELIYVFILGVSIGLFLGLLLFRKKTRKDCLEIKLKR
ncbi:MAG: hypothetical protein PHV16_04725 [Candidatus Nanoarchaeia archaeon]|nr:hypothetical protein [Candidatus Nanoarchaeia archaeon]